MKLKHKKEIDNAVDGGTIIYTRDSLFYIIGTCALDFFVRYLNGDDNTQMQYYKINNNCVVRVQKIGTAIGLGRESIHLEARSLGLLKNPPAPERVIILHFEYEIKA